jgi:hypothetical protein
MYKNTCFSLMLLLLLVHIYIVIGHRRTRDGLKYDQKNLLRLSLTIPFDVVVKNTDQMHRNVISAKFVPSPSPGRVRD